MHATIVDADALGSHLGPVEKTGALLVALKRLNGFYAWIKRPSGRIRAPIRHNGSPLVSYANYQACSPVSDNAEWAPQLFSDWAMNPVAR